MMAWLEFEKSYQYLAWNLEKVKKIKETKKQKWVGAVQTNDRRG